MRRSKQTTIGLFAVISCEGIDQKTMKVTIFGTGYVGLVTGACLADVGHHVLCVDVDVEKIEKLKQGVIPIYEPGLDSVVNNNFGNGQLDFTTDAALAVAHGDIQMIAVGTPPDEDGSADLQYVLAVADTIASHMTCEKVVVTKSTVPVGTADKVSATIQQRLQQRELALSVSVVSNPEFLKEGDAVSDFMKPDHIIIGAEDETAQQVMCELYEPFNRNHNKIHCMSVRSAELTKYAANAMLATRISFMNELAVLAETLGADIEEVRHGIGSDPRIGYHFLYAGCGYGGSCFPKDVKALKKTGEEVGVPLRVISAVEEANDAQKQLMVTKLTQRFGNDLTNKRFAIWGLSFKPNTDDMREAPSRVILEALWQLGARVSAYDPVAMEETRRIYGERADLMLVDSPMDALKNAEALMIVTEWKAFRSPDFDTIKSLLRQPVIFDGRNLYDPKRIRAMGFEYFAIGR